MQCCNYSLQLLLHKLWVYIILSFLMADYIYLGMQIHTAIKVFQNMKYCSVPSNGATYVIMIDCCSSLRCFKSACALVSLMLREGYNLETMTYTALIKVKFFFYRLLLHSKWSRIICYINIWDSIQHSLSKLWETHVCVSKTW